MRDIALQALDGSTDILYMCLKNWISNHQHHALRPQELLNLTIYHVLINKNQPYSVRHRFPDLYVDSVYIVRKVTMGGSHRTPRPLNGAANNLHSSTRNDGSNVLD